LLCFDRKGLEQLAPDIRVLAAKEGLTAHWASVEARLGRDEKQT
jgi:histidinol dehydrogenase